MKSNYRYMMMLAAVLFTTVAPCVVRAVDANGGEIIPGKEASLIAHLVREANRPGSHSPGDVYLLVTIGKTAYTAELRSGGVVGQKRVEEASGGFYGAYAEVSLVLMDKNKKETSQGSGQVLRLDAGKWQRIALSEGDYQCGDLKGISKSVLRALKVECN